MADALPTWTLERFLDRFDLWAAQENPSEDLRVIVTEWIMSRSEDPYQGVRREPGFENLWFGAVPNSQDGNGNVVTCSFWIFESKKMVRCDLFSTLALPI